MSGVNRLKNKSAGGVVSAALVSSFIVWGRMIEAGSEYIPGGWRGAWLMTVLAFAFSLLIFPFFAIVSDTASADTHRSLPYRAARFFASLAFSAAAVAVGLSALNKGSGFVINAMEIGEDSRLIAAVLLLVAAYMASSGPESIKKFSFVSLSFTLAASLLLLIMAWSRGGMTESITELLSEAALRDASDTEGLKKAFLGVFAPCVVAIAWLSVTSEKRNAAGDSVWRTMLGILVGGGILASCFATVALSQGIAYSSSQRYPYVSAVGSMTAGKLFMRPEGVVYFGYISAVFVVLSVCLSFISRFADRGSSKRTPYAAAAVMMILYFFAR